MLLKFRFSSATYYELFSTGINLSLIAFTILAGILWNMFILLLHLQFKVILVGTLKFISEQTFCNVNNVRRNFDMNLEWLNGLRSEESMFLGYIFDDFILNLFLKHLSSTCHEKLSQHAEKPNAVKQLV